MIELNTSPVVFSEAEHTYTLGDKQLSGITSIISKYALPDMYSGVSSELLHEKAEHGTLVHNQVQLVNLGIESSKNEPEVLFYEDYIKRNCIKVIAAEYTVNDAKYDVASNIDIVFDAKCKSIDGKPMVDLVDIKTTSVLNKEYLQWQLSLYARMFEAQNPHLAVRKLIALHLTGEACEDKVIKRLEDKYLEDLLSWYTMDVAGLISSPYINPLHIISGEFNELAAEYRKLTAEILDYEAAVKPLVEIRDKIKSKLVEAIKNDNKTTGEHGGVKVTISKSERKSWDMKKFAELHPNFVQRYGKAFDDGYTTKVTESARVTVK